MRKFIHNGAIKYTDNPIKARRLLSLGYKEVEADEAPKFDAHQAQPADPDAETKKVEKGAHTTEEPTTDKAEAAAVEEADDKPKTTKKTTSKKK